MKKEEKEIKSLKEEVKEMWDLVISQLEMSKKAFLENNITKAIEVVRSERQVNAFELKIDLDCENYIARYSPVAIDLRMALSLIQISNTLERIGDFAEGIAQHIIDSNRKKIDPELLEELRVEAMFDLLIVMLLDSYIAFESENTKNSKKLIMKDRQVDEIYINAFTILTQFIEKQPQNSYHYLKLILLIRRLERIGDHCNNIIEDIVFYVDAQVLKHKNIKDK